MYCRKVWNAHDGTLSGDRDFIIEPPIMIFRTKDQIFPIRGVPDDIYGVSFSSVTKGWMDYPIIPLKGSYRKVIRPLPKNWG